jgi:2-methylcitrate dehydratase PrpD
MIIDELAANIVNTSFDVFDTDTLKKAKNRLIDIVGCAIGGANAPGCPELRDLVKEWGGKQEATILIHGGKVPAHNAALINSIMARSYDFGVLTPFIGEKAIWSHISETTVPTAITMAEWQHVGGKELLTALILGDDLSTRISAASSYLPGASWDSPGTINKFGAAAIACKLMGLNERQIINSMGIVLNQLAGTFQPINEGAVSFKLVQGLSARDGIIAAELAKKGWNAGKDPLLGKYGYFSLYCQKSDPEYLIKDLGKKFYGDEIFKPYPSCRFIHSSIDCALQIVQENEINAEDIEKVTLNLAPMHYGSTLDNPFEPGEFPQCNANFSLRYHVANVLVRKCVKLEHLTEASIREPEVGKLAGKVNVTGSLPPEKIEAAGLKVKLKDGRELNTYVDVAKGHPLKKPLSKKEIEEKFRANVTFSKTISEENSEKALKLLNRVEEIDDIGELVKLLTIG